MVFSTRQQILCQIVLFEVITPTWLWLELWHEINRNIETNLWMNKWSSEINAFGIPIHRVDKNFWLIWNYSLFRPWFCVWIWVEIGCHKFLYFMANLHLNNWYKFYSLSQCIAQFGLTAHVLFLFLPHENRIPSKTGILMKILSNHSKYTSSIEQQFKQFKSILCEKYLSVGIFQKEDYTIRNPA